MKRIPPHELGALCKQLRQSGGSIVFVPGMFDLLHPGHIHCLTESRKLGQHVVVGVQTSGHRPALIGLEERVEVLAALEMVDHVTWIDDETTAELLREIRPDVLVNGNPEIITLVESLGGRAVRIPRLEGYDTLEIVERIRKTN